MRKFNPLKGGTLTLFVISLLTFCAGGNAMAQNPEQGMEFRNTGFVLAQDVTLHPLQVNQEQGNGLAGGAIQLPVGTELAILDIREDAQGRFLHVGLDADEQSGLPQDFWVSASELPESALVPYAPADESADGAVSEYDLFGVRGKRGMTYCYRYVKQYLLQTGKVPVYLPGGSAWMAASILPRYGFRKLGVGPAGTINGDVCVYTGGRGGNGHIEVKRNGAWWYGYGFIPHPISLKNHRLIGCFRK